ncbi:unnamed protein product [Closterium sp. NIES-64]|nr:unnamed protein product [Closterium sp. NIES-64]
MSALMIGAGVAGVGPALLAGAVVTAMLGAVRFGLAVRFLGVGVADAARPSLLSLLAKFLLAASRALTYQPLRVSREAAGSCAASVRAPRTAASPSPLATPFVRGDCRVRRRFRALLLLLRLPRPPPAAPRSSRLPFVGALASAALRSGVMDPSARRDPELEHSAESAPREPAPAEPRPRLPAHPSASEPVHRFERVQTLPHQPASRLSPPEYSWAPARVASNRPDGQQPQQRGRSPQRHPQRQPSPRRLSPARREHYQRREGDPRSPERPRSPRRPSPRGRAGQRSPRARSPPLNNHLGELRRRGGRGRLGVAGNQVVASRPLRVRIRVVPLGGGGRRNGGGRGSSGRQPDPALDHAANTFVDVVRQARASGGPTHVHIEVTNGPPFAADPGPVAPLRAPMLAEYLPARVGRPDYRSPRQVPGFSAGCLTVGRVPGWSASFPLEEQTAPHPNPVGETPC